MSKFFPGPQGIPDSFGGTPMRPNRDYEDFFSHLDSFNREVPSHPDPIQSASTSIQNRMALAGKAADLGLMNRNQFERLYDRLQSDPNDTGAGRVLQRKLSEIQQNPTMAARVVAGQQSRANALDQYHERIIAPFTASNSPGRGLDWYTNPVEVGGESYLQFGVRKSGSQTPQWSTYLAVDPATHRGDAGSLMMGSSPGWMQRMDVPMVLSERGIENQGMRASSERLQSLNFQRVFGAGQQPQLSLRQDSISTGRTYDEEHGAAMNWAAQDFVQPGLKERWQQSFSLEGIHLSDDNNGPSSIIGGQRYDNEFTQGIADKLNPGESRWSVGRQWLYQNAGIFQRNPNQPHAFTLDSLQSSLGTYQDERGYAIPVNGIFKALKRVQNAGLREQALYGENGIIDPMFRQGSMGVAGTGETQSGQIFNTFFSVSGNALLGAGASALNLDTQGNKEIFQPRTWSFDLEGGKLTDDTRQWLSENMGQSIRGPVAINGVNQDLVRNWDRAVIEDYQIENNQLHLSGRQIGAETSIKQGPKGHNVRMSFSQAGLPNVDFLTPFGGNMSTSISGIFDAEQALDPGFLKSMMGEHMDKFQHGAIATPEMIDAFTNKYLPGRMEEIITPVSVHNSIVDNLLGGDESALRSIGLDPSKIGANPIQSIIRGQGDISTAMVKTMGFRAPFMTSVNPEHIGRASANNLELQMASTLFGSPEFAAGNPYEGVGGEVRSAHENIMRSVMATAGGANAPEMLTDAESISQAQAQTYMANTMVSPEGSTERDVLLNKLGALQNSPFGGQNSFQFGNTFLPSAAAMANFVRADDTGQEVGMARRYTETMDKFLQGRASGSPTNNADIEEFSGYLSKEASSSGFRKNAMGAGKTLSSVPGIQIQSNVLAPNMLAANANMFDQAMQHMARERGVEMSHDEVRSERQRLQGELGYIPTSYLHNPNSDPARQSTFVARGIDERQLAKLTGGSLKLGKGQIALSPFGIAGQRSDTDADLGQMRPALTFDPASKRFGPLPVTPDQDVIQNAMYNAGKEIPNMLGEWYGDKVVPKPGQSHEEALQEYVQEQSQKRFTPEQLTGDLSEIISRRSAGMGQIFNIWRSLQAGSGPLGLTKEQLSTGSAVMSTGYQESMDALFGPKGATGQMQSFEQLLKIQTVNPVTGYTGTGEKIDPGVASGRDRRGARNGGRNLDLIANQMIGSYINMSGEEATAAQAAAMVTPAGFDRSNDVAQMIEAARNGGDVAGTANQIRTMVAGGGSYYSENGDSLRSIPGLSHIALGALKAEMRGDEFYSGNGVPDEQSNQILHLLGGAGARIKAGTELLGKGRLSPQELSQNMGLIGSSLYPDTPEYAGANAVWGERVKSLGVKSISPQQWVAARRGVSAPVASAPSPVAPSAPAAPPGGRPPIPPAGAPPAMPGEPDDELGRNIDQWMAYSSGPAAPASTPAMPSGLEKVLSSIQSMLGPKPQSPDDYLKAFELDAGISGIAGQLAAGGYSVGSPENMTPESAKRVMDLFSKSSQFSKIVTKADDAFGGKFDNNVSANIRETFGNRDRLGQTKQGGGFSGSLAAQASGYFQSDAGRAELQQAASLSGMGGGQLDVTQFQTDIDVMNHALKGMQSAFAETAKAGGKVTEEHAKLVQMYDKAAERVRKTTDQAEYGAGTDAQAVRGIAAANQGVIAGGEALLGRPIGSTGRNLRQITSYAGQTGDYAGEEISTRDAFAPFLMRGRNRDKAMAQMREAGAYGSSPLEQGLTEAFGTMASLPYHAIHARYELRGIQQEFLGPMEQSRQTYLQSQQAQMQNMMQFDAYGGAGIIGTNAFASAVRPEVLARNQQLAFGEQSNRAIGGLYDLASSVGSNRVVAQAQTLGSMMMAGAAGGGLISLWNPMGVAAGAAAGGAAFLAGQVGAAANDSTIRQNTFINEARGGANYAFGQDPAGQFGTYLSEAFGGKDYYNKVLGDKALAGRVADFMGNKLPSVGTAPHGVPQSAQDRIAAGRAKDYDFEMAYTGHLFDKTITQTQTSDQAYDPMSGAPMGGETTTTKIAGGVLEGLGENLPDDVSKQLAARTVAMMGGSEVMQRNPDQARSTFEALQRSTQGGLGTDKQAGILANIRGFNGAYLEGAGYGQAFRDVDKFLSGPNGKLFSTVMDQEAPGQMQLANLQKAAGQRVTAGGLDYYAKMGIAQLTGDMTTQNTLRYQDSISGMWAQGAGSSDLFSQAGKDTQAYKTIFNETDPNRRAYYQQMTGAFGNNVTRLEGLGYTLPEAGKMTDVLARALPTGTSQGVGIQAARDAAIIGGPQDLTINKLATMGNAGFDTSSIAGFARYGVDASLGVTGGYNFSMGRDDKGGQNYFQLMGAGQRMFANWSTYGGGTQNNFEYLQTLASNNAGNLGEGQFQLAVLGGDPIANSQYADRYGVNGSQDWRRTVQTGSRGGTQGMSAGYDEYISRTISSERQARGVRQNNITAGGAYSASELSGMNEVQIDAAMNQQQIQLRNYDFGLAQKQLNRQQSSMYTEWGFEDRGIALGRTQQDFSYTQQGKQIGLQKEQMGYDYSYQKQSMGIQRSHQVEEQQWGLQDLAYQRNTSQLQFGFSMIDADESVRYSTGRSRRDAMRHRDEAVTMHSMSMGQMDKEEERAKQRIKWSDDQFNRDQQHFEKEHEFQQRNFTLTEQNYTKQREFIMQQRTLEDEQRVFRRQIQQVEMQEAQESLRVHQQAKITMDNLGAAAQNAQSILKENGASLNYMGQVGDLANKSLDMFIQKLQTIASMNGGGAATQHDFYQGQSSQDIVAAYQRIWNQTGGSASPAGSQRSVTGSMSAMNMSFADGGYTGPGSKYQPAGVVHRGEYVVPQGGSLVMQGGNGEKHLENIAKTLQRIYEEGGNVLFQINQSTPQKAMRGGTKLFDRSWN